MASPSILVTLFVFSCVFATTHGKPLSANDKDEPLPVGPEDVVKAKKFEDEQAATETEDPMAERCVTSDMTKDEEEAMLRNAVIDPRKLWTESFNVYLDPSLNYTDEEMGWIVLVLGRLQDVFGECLKIKLYPAGATPSGDYVHVRKTGSCMSESIGRKGGSQGVNLPTECLNLRIIAHEFMHALGLEHEQNRPDRDDYVNIHWENIDEEHHRQFRKLDSRFTSTYGVDYNYYSLMHYSDLNFSKNGQKTITAKDPAVPIVGGSRFGHITETDRLKLRRMYKCNGQ